MGLMDSLENMAANAMSSSGNSNAKVAGGLMEALNNHPGGLGGVLESLRNNGMQGHVDAMQNGEAPPMTPDQVQTGLGNTGLIDSVARRAGVSPEVAKAGMAVVLPMVMAHFAKTGQAPDQSSLGGILSKIL